MLKRIVISISPTRKPYNFSIVSQFHSTNPLLCAAEKSKTHFDCVVIGGGSGGLAAAREASSKGARVALFDYVHPSTHGNTWGIGGTCVNVGCIPKVLFHQAALLGQSMDDAKTYGWSIPSPQDGNNTHVKHNWKALVQNVQGVIKGINWGYRVALRDEGIHYINARASLKDSKTIQYIEGNGDKNKYQYLSASNIIIAVGGRPRYIDIPGSELAITSDDLFSLSNPPGKTLLIGGGYVALECAGFLSELGYNASVMARGQLLRGFDQQMASLIAGYMEEKGTAFIRGAQPIRITKVKNQGSPTTSTNTTSNEFCYDVEFTDAAGNTQSDIFDTVVMATGRDPVTNNLGLDKLNINVTDSGHIVTDKFDASSIENIYAVGDVAFEKPELTPVAIQAGQLLAGRLFGGSKKTMNYNSVATTVFTPLEYGCVGVSEEVAENLYGKENIEIFHSKYDTIQMQAAHRVNKNDGFMNASCYSKVICERGGDKKILGGDVIQGFALGLKLGATKMDLDDLVGIHPTHAEEVVGMAKTKRSGEDPTKSSC